MPHLFRPYADTIARCVLVSIAVAPILLIGLGYWVTASEYTTDQPITVDQPVPFSHAHHVGGLGLDCRYCHTGHVTALVGPNGDVHVYSPTPADAEAIRNARLVNGLGLLEGWLPRLIESSGSNAITVVATHGIVPRKIAAGEILSRSHGAGRRIRMPGNPYQMSKSTSAISATPW